MIEGKKGELIETTRSGLKVGGDIQFTRKDLATVAVSRYETQLMKRRSELEARVHQTNSKRMRAQREAKDLLKTTADSLLVEEMKKAEDALNAMGFNINTNRTHIVKDDKLQVNFVLKSDSGENRSYNQLSLTRTYDLPEGFAALEARIEDATNYLRTLGENISTVQQGLANMGALERRATAALTEAVLNESEEGQRLAASLTSLDVDGIIPSLPELEAPGADDKG